MNKHIDSYIAGDFEGWDGDAVYELDDGSRWELLEYQYRYAYQYRPRARVWRDGVHYYLEVAGMDGRPEVREIP
jgi:hypothetical protein